MVSSSRKKNKGKDRKNKKIEAERIRKRSLWLGWAIGEDKATGKKIQCDHGRVTIPDDLDHPVSRFLNDFATYWDASTKHNNDSPLTTVALMRATFETNPQVWNNENYKQMAVSILTTMGANVILMKVVRNDIEYRTKVDNRGIVWALCIAKKQLLYLSIIMARLVLKSQSIAEV